MLFMFGMGVQVYADTGQVGQVAPDFECVTADGKTVRLSDYRGKVVVLDFWASWCGPCREEMPFLSHLYRLNQAQGFEVLAINIDNKRENMKKFLAKLDQKPTFSILLDPQKAVPRMYEIESMPTTVFIDRAGVVRYRHNGFTKSDEEVLEHTLQVLLAGERRVLK